VQLLAQETQIFIVLSWCTGGFTRLWV